MKRKVSKQVKNQRRQKAHLVSLAKEQMEYLSKILSENKIPGTSLMLQKGIPLTAFSGLTKKSKLWIIDSGAIDHMTGCEKLSSSYTPSPKHQES